MGGAVSATAILDEARRRGVELVAAGDRLRFRPVYAVTPELRDALARNKAELLLLLAPGNAMRNSATPAWRKRLTPAELARFPRDGDPPADFIRDVLAVRAAIDGEIVEVAWPSLGPLAETPRGFLAPERLPAAWREWYEERAAIREHDGGEPREHAEAAALAETLAAMKKTGEFQQELA